MNTIEELENRILDLEKKVEQLMSQGTSHEWKEWGEIRPSYFNNCGTLYLASSSTLVKIEYKIESGKILYRGTLKDRQYLLSVDKIEGEANKGYAKYKFTHKFSAGETYRFNLPMTVDELG